VNILEKTEKHDYLTVRMERRKLNPEMEIEEEIFFKECLKNSADDGVKVVLVSTGSFNPAHRMHIEIFEYACQYIKKQNFELLCGIITPSSDEYVKMKLL
jgi:hypothetical protein